MSAGRCGGENRQLSVESTLVCGPRFAAGDVGREVRIFLQHTRSLQPAQHRHHQKVTGAERAIQPVGIAEPTGKVAQPFPDADLEDTQALLGPDEALILWITSDDQTELFAITRDSIDWHTLPIKSEELTQKVAAFRRGLSVDAASAAASEQFDLAVAHAFFKDLLAPVNAVLQHKRNLLVVPTGA